MPRPISRRLHYQALMLCLPMCAGAAPATFENAVQPLVAKACYACHNAKIASGRLNLEAYKTAASVIEARDRWERVVRKLETGEMPPKGAPRPDQGEIKEALAWIRSEFDKADALVKPD